MAGYAGEISVQRKRKTRGWNTHCRVNLFNVGLPAEESNSKERGNDQGCEDIGSSPSLDRTGRNSENEEDNSRYRESGLMKSQRQWRLSNSQQSVAIPKTSKRALEISFVNLGMSI